MKSIIREMFYEKKGNCSSVKFNTKEHAEIINKIVAHENKLKINLATSIELFELYGKISDANSQLNCEIAASHYVEGFKFGVLLGLELMQD